MVSDYDLMNSKYNELRDLIKNEGTESGTINFFTILCESQFVCMCIDVVFIHDCIFNKNCT